MTSASSNPDLRSIALRAMTRSGLATDFPAEVLREALSLSRAGGEKNIDASVRDMRDVPWSSIDNPESRDLDQVEYVERLPDGRLRLLIGIADVDSFVPKGSVIDRHAFVNTVSVYTPAIIFPMLPEPLSTDKTSLLEGEDRLAVVIELIITGGGDVSSKDVYRAAVRNHAKLTYGEVGEWLEGRSSVPDAVANIAGLEDQIRLQSEATERLHALRKENGALELETVQAAPVLSAGEVVGLDIKRHNRAQSIIESFMIAANTSMAEFLQERGVPSLRRVVRTPERWPQIVKLAASFGVTLQPTPDSRALSDFLTRRKAADPKSYAELSLSVLKMLGGGDYRVETPELEQQGHFGLAVHDYTHSTAPNRRYPDLITQRCLKAAISGTALSYTAEELEEIADRCNRMESAARKVERTTEKSAVAVLMSNRRGEIFDGIVTGVKERGTFVRLIAPPAEGRIVKGEEGLSVGEKVQVRLLSAEPERGFIDFAKV
ncbi:MAG TPA: RNB domain-containing ribonuclease [Pyrinomonadaceae bacterium]|nr:RNB domain-containing ribonuclease [Pyrinomonadaceae bacterium]